MNVSGLLKKYQLSTFSFVILKRLSYGTLSYFLCSKSLSLSWKRKGKKNTRAYLYRLTRALALALALTLTCVVEMTLDAQEQENHDRRRSSRDENESNQRMRKNNSNATEKNETAFLVVAFRVVVFLLSFAALYVSTRAYSVIVRFLNERRRTTLYRYSSFPKYNNNNNNNNNSNNAESVDSALRERFLWTTREVVLLSDTKINTGGVKEKHRRSDDKRFNRLYQKAKRLHVYFTVSLCEVMLKALGHSEITIEGCERDANIDIHSHSTPLVVVSNAPRISEILFFVQYLRRSIPLFISAAPPSLLHERSTTALEATILDAVGSDQIFFGKTFAHRQQYVHRMKKLLALISGRLPTIYFPEVAGRASLTHVLEFDENLFAKGQKVQPVTLLFSSSSSSSNRAGHRREKATHFVRRLYPKRFESLADLFLAKTNPLKVTFLPSMKPSKEENENLKVFAERVRTACAEALDVPKIDTEVIHKSTTAVGTLLLPYSQ
jgi:hypothetical protein